MSAALANGLQLAFCAAVILAAGTRLSRYGDAIAAHTGLGGNWVGLVLMAGLVGSNLFNLAILAVDDLLYVEGPLLVAASPAHAVSAVSGSVMAGGLIVALLARPQARLLNAFAWTSVLIALVYLLNAFAWTSVLIALVYLLNAWLQFTHGR